MVRWTSDLTAVFYKMFLDLTGPLLHSGQMKIFPRLPSKIAVGLSNIHQNSSIIMSIKNPIIYACQVQNGQQSSL